MSISFAAVAEDVPFHAGPADSYAHQAADGVTVGAKAFDRPELIEPAFGKKAEFLKYGVLPVLVVIDNRGKGALNLQGLEVSLVATDGRHASAVSPDELFHIGHPTKRPNVRVSPIPLPKKKNTLDSPAIIERSFAAKMLPPGDVASGFFYFEARPESGDKLYLNGIRQARSGEDLIYFEFPLDR